MDQKNEFIKDLSENLHKVNDALQIANATIF